MSTTTTPTTDAAARTRFEELRLLAPLNRARFVLDEPLFLSVAEVPIDEVEAALADHDAALERLREAEEIAAAIERLRCLGVEDPRRYLQAAA